MIVTFTDFGLDGPYLGEMRLAALRKAPTIGYVDLMTDAPLCRPDLAAYLLAALARRLQSGDVVIAVVDPGVGSERKPLAIEVDGVWFVGPDNGLFEIVLRRARVFRCFAIAWRPPSLSSSFHGRDLFAPTAARLATGNDAWLEPTEPTRHLAWPDDLDRIVHVDRFGNLVTGRRAVGLTGVETIVIGGHSIGRARTFSDVPEGGLLFYANSMALLEIARNKGSAAAQLGLEVGASLRLQRAPPGST